MSPQKPSGQGTGASVLSSQSSFRYVATFRDQHALSTCRWAKDGRPWWGYREMAANRGDIDGFCSPLTPGDHEAEIKEQWDAPWMPDPVWFEYDYRRGRIRIRYDRMITHYDTVAAMYYRRVNIMCSKNGWPAVERGAIPRDSVTDVFGDPPLNSRIFKAAQASHPWVLGFSDEPDEELARMLALTIPGAGIYSPPRKEGLVSVERTLSLTEEQMDAKIAKAVEAALKMKAMKSPEHGKKIQAGRARSAAERAALQKRIELSRRLDQEQQAQEPEIEEPVL